MNPVSWEQDARERYEAQEAGTKGTRGTKADLLLKT